MAEYLAAKRTVDDRALNDRVWRRFVSELQSESDRVTDREEPIRIVDVGTGIGSMAARLAERERFERPVSYHGIDIDPEVIDAGRSRLPHWLEAAGYDVTSDGHRIVARPRNSQTESTSSPQRFEITLEVADVASIAADADGVITDDADAAIDGADESIPEDSDLLIADDPDAVIAAAFLDVVDLETVLPRLQACLGDGGLLYAPCTYAGRTSFVPSDPLDGRIERLYHRHMDEIRDRPGSSRAGEQLLQAAPRFGFDTLEVGGGDWVVRPSSTGYEAQEGTFLEFLLETINGALADYPDSVLSDESREAWITKRRRQIQDGELTMIAHNLDVLARR